MLERLPSAVGRALRRVRPGVDRFICRSSVVRSALPVIEVTSPAFGDQQPLPVRTTADGEGMPPPLAWGDVPEGTRSIALLVEDADSPTPAPLVHAIGWHIEPALRQLAEGELSPGDHHFSLGINSFLRLGWLPPDPPPGHGLHRSGFQVFALDHDPEHRGDAGAEHADPGAAWPHARLRPADRHLRALIDRAPIDAPETSEAGARQVATRNRANRTAAYLAGGDAASVSAGVADARGATRRTPPSARHRS